MARAGCFQRTWIAIAVVVLALPACSGDDSGASAGTGGGTSGSSGSTAGAGGNTAGTGVGVGGAGGGTGGSGGTGAAGVALPPCSINLDPGADLNAAAAGAKPGDVFCLAQGDYGPFRIQTSGTEQAPIVFRAKAGDERLARITDDGTFSQGIQISNASHVIIDGLWVDQINQGIYVYYSDYIVAQHCKVTKIGQECLRFKHSSYGAFIGNDVQTCGVRYLEGLNGEGIYVGSGEENGDDTHDALISGNHIQDTRDEGIELKGSTANCVVEANVLHDLLIKDGGGIVVAGPDLPNPSLAESGHIVRGNIVYNVQTRTVYQDGNGLNVRRGALVYDNLSYGNQHYGIRIDDKEGYGGNVKLYHNTFYGNAVDDLGVFDSAVTDIRNNLGTSSNANLPATADLFVNATGGDFHLVGGASAIDAGQDVGVSVDIEGTPRPQGSAFDFGAYEYK